MFSTIITIIILIKEVCKVCIIFKAGEPIWKGLIPYRRDHTYSVVVFGDGRFFWALYGPIFLLAIFSASNLHVPIFMSLGPLMGPVFTGFTVVISLFVGGLFVWESITVAEVFGRGKLYAAGLFFFPFIFYPLLVMNETYYG